MSKLYYQPPSQEIFDEVKEKAIEVWDTYYRKPYSEEKINRIEELDNFGDNFMFIVQMFDMHNQYHLSVRIGERANEEIRARLIDGGADENLIVF